MNKNLGVCDGVTAEGEHRRVGAIPDSPVWLVSTAWHCTVSYEVCLYYAEAEEDGRYQQKPSDVTF